MLVAHLRSLLSTHRPADDEEAEHLASMSALLEQPAPCARSSESPGHFTASAFVLSPEGDEVLLIHHGKLHRWLQPGGHIDPDDTDVFAAACREVAEETGLTDVTVAPGRPFLLDVDVHDIPANPRKGEGPHKHFDVRILLRAHTRTFQAGSDALAAKWVPLDEVVDIESDASVTRAIAKLQAQQARQAAWSGSHSPAAERNRGPILEVMRRFVPPGARVLEVACGTGEHAAHVGGGLDVRWWQPTDVRDEALGATAFRVQAVEGVRPPARLQVRHRVWPVSEADVVYCANMIHIAPWDSCLALLAGAGRVLANGGQIVLYGPFRMDGAHTAPSNAAFDASLRARDPSWGVRDLEAVVAEARAHGLHWRETVPMPANNFIVRFERT
jgi:8-oxo-dGTP pyrophosphatase MutT (NUDIX family)